MNTSLSQSKVKTWLRCPKKFEYRYVQNLQPKTKPLPMERGVWIHECLEDYYKGKDWTRVITKLKKHFRTLFDEERELYGDLPGEVERIVKSYLSHWDDDDWEILAVENEFNVKLKSGLVLKGRMDMVVRDNIGVWVVENKTNQRLPSEIPRIPDPQTTLYNFALKSMGLKGAGTIHNHIRTLPPKEPRVLKNGGLSVRCDTDYYTYRQAVKREGLDPKDYRAVLHRLKREDKYFRRFRVPWRKTAVKPMLADYNEVARMIDGATRYPRNLGFMCEKDCFYFQICIMELYGGDSSQLKKTKFNVDERAYG